MHRPKTDDSYTTGIRVKKPRPKTNNLQKLHIANSITNNGDTTSTASTTTTNNFANEINVNNANTGNVTGDVVGDVVGNTASTGNAWTNTTNSGANSPMPVKQFTAANSRRPYNDTNNSGTNSPVPVKQFAPANSRRPYNETYMNELREMYKNTATNTNTKTTKTKKNKQPKQNKKINKTNKTSDTSKPFRVIKLPVASQNKLTETDKAQQSRQFQYNMDNYKKYANMTASEDDTLKTKIQKKTKQCMCMNYKVMDATSTLMDKDVEVTRCTASAIQGSDFCAKHKSCPNMYKQYLTGAEPPLADDNWNSKFVRNSHNCYAYFLDDQKPTVADKCQNICKTKRNGDKSCPEKHDDCRIMIPQPGDFGYLNSVDRLNDSNTNCSSLTYKILKDNPSIKPTTFTDKCPANYYKGAVVVNANKSFHFYRQNRDGKWSHKPGVLPVNHTDASGNQIWVPHFADRNYLEDPQYGTTYSQFCSYYCIPSNQHIVTNSA